MSSTPPRQRTGTARDSPGRSRPEGNRARASSPNRPTTPGRQRPSAPAAAVPRATTPGRQPIGRRPSDSSPSASPQPHGSPAQKSPPRGSSPRLSPPRMSREEALMRPAYQAPQMSVRASGSPAQQAKFPSRGSPDPYLRSEPSDPSLARKPSIDQGPGRSPAPMVVRGASALEDHHLPPVRHPPTRPSPHPSTCPSPASSTTSFSILDHTPLHAISSPHPPHRPIPPHPTISCACFSVTSSLVNGCGR